MTANPVGFEGLLQVLRRARRMQVFVTSLPWALFAAALPAGLLAVLAALDVPSLPWAHSSPAVLVVALLGPAVLGIAVAAVRSLVAERRWVRRPEELLRAADAVYGSRNLLEAAWETRRAPEGFGGILQGRAARLAPTIDAGRVYPVADRRTLGTGLVALLVFGALVAAAVLVEPGPGLGATSTPVLSRFDGNAPDLPGLRDEEESASAGVSDLDPAGGEGEGAPEGGDHDLDRVQDQIAGLERAPVTGEVPDQGFPEDPQDTPPGALRTTEAEEGADDVFVPPRGRTAGDGETEEVDELVDESPPDIAEDFVDETGDEEPGEGAGTDESAEGRPGGPQDLDNARPSDTPPGTGEAQLEEGPAGDTPGGEVAGGGSPREPNEGAEWQPPDSPDPMGSRGGATPAEDSFDDDFMRLENEEPGLLSELEGQLEDGPILNLLLREPPREGIVPRTGTLPPELIAEAREAALALEQVPTAFRRIVRDYFLRLARGRDDGEE